jgi:tRNA N6-adenosine threonylcarbamoyltransferase
MTILGIETSCDETAVAVIEGKENHVMLKSDVLATSLALHAKTGGIIPEQAAREQIKYILPTLRKALDTNDTSDTLKQIDAIAVTYGPGLIGSLLVGVETAKTLAFVLNKPIIPVNHMVGHIYANFILENGKSHLAPSPQSLVPEFPAIALVVSGGHTDLLLMKKHGDFKLLGGTRDDAAGEAFDKIGRMMGLTYPAGPEIERLARNGNPKRFRFPRPLLHESTYEFSFSGLKTAVLREVHQLKKLDNQTIADLARSTQDAITEVLVKKTLRAAKQYKVKSLLLSGGVAANQTLREAFEQTIKDQQLPVKLFAPTRRLCTDNAAMIASAAYFNFKPEPWETITADPELYFD